MRSTDGEMYTTKLRAIKIVDMDAAKKLMVGKTVALLPGVRRYLDLFTAQSGCLTSCIIVQGYIYTQQGNDMRTILLENKVAEVVPTRFEYDYDTPQQEPDMIKNPAYADRAYFFPAFLSFFLFFFFRPSILASSVILTIFPMTADFSNMFLMLFVSSLALLLVSYRGDTPPSDARIFQSYNRENPIPKRVALILLWFIIGGIVLWLLMVLRVGYRLYNGKTILSD
jgi:hypothetical protein